MTSKNIGGENPKAKLDDLKVREIIKLKSAGYKQKDLALMYDVSRSTVAMILAGRTWRHIQR